MLQHGPGPESFLESRAVRTVQEILLQLRPYSKRHMMVVLHSFWLLLKTRMFCADILMFFSAFHLSVSSMIFWDPVFWSCLY